MNNGCNRRAGTGANVGGRPRDGSRYGDATEQRRNEIGRSLANEFDVVQSDLRDVLLRIHRSGPLIRQVVAPFAVRQTPAHHRRSFMGYRVRNRTLTQPFSVPPFDRSTVHYPP
jgi:hypothetical protein